MPCDLQLPQYTYSIATSLYIWDWINCHSGDCFLQYLLADSPTMIMNQRYHQSVITLLCYNVLGHLDCRDGIGTHKKTYIQQNRLHLEQLLHVNLWIYVVDGLVKMEDIQCIGPRKFRCVLWRPIKKHAI